MMRKRLALSLALALGCGADGAVMPSEEAGSAIDLPLGDTPEDDGKADGQWGDALNCKPVPALPVLANPEIFVSLHGHTVRLVDRAAGFEKVFAVGVGALETKATDAAFGESKSYYPVIATGRQDFAITPSSIQPCKTWWTDPDTGVKTPVFAGLPFMAFYGGYAFHGPIDNYKAPNGGNLRRGFVSHGCVRMESADVLELYARIKGRARVPVHVQREPERDGAGRRVDTQSKWVGSECSADADCNYAGGFCHANDVGGRGFCSLRCSGTCPDRANLPTTACIADPAAAGQGMCVLRAQPQNSDCRSWDHLTAQTRRRFNSTTSATVCAPGSRGWVGERCLQDADCTSGTTCAGEGPGKAGVCTEACSAACPDQPGFATTTCVKSSPLGGAGCLRTCTPASNAPECPASHDCRAMARPNGTTRNVCVPR